MKGIHFPKVMDKPSHEIVTVHYVYIYVNKNVSVVKCFCVNNRLTVCQRSEKPQTGYTAKTNPKVSYIFLKCK